MKIRGVFSMSIINRLKSLFKEEKDFEEKDVQEEISKDVNSESSDFDDTVVSGTKTSVPISDVLKKEKSSTATIELKFKKEVRSIEEESVEETLPIIEEEKILLKMRKILTLMMKLNQLRKLTTKKKIKKIKREII